MRALERTEIYVHGSGVRNIWTVYAAVYVDGAAVIVYQSIGGVFSATNLSGIDNYQLIPFVPVLTGCCKVTRNYCSSALVADCPCTWSRTVLAHGRGLSLTMVTDCPCTWSRTVLAHGRGLSLHMVTDCPLLISPPGFIPCSGCQPKSTDYLYKCVKGGESSCAEPEPVALGVITAAE
ncbi:hypothetical protein BV898_09642 [Hypsibius exemplaris]|uniref:Uncharacterized protein n=1 Tax=Hypsibius exemplaris TaxID=2072580 RepID=A0A1W0WLS8_HYPEX|nr:hypothetical protein BV898_09642 [Hypsibius exemplaris]